MIITWSPGMSLESLEEKIFEASIKFYISEERAADSLKIPLKEFQKKVKKFRENETKRNDLMLAQKQKQEEFIRRSRGSNSVPI